MRKTIDKTIEMGSERAERIMNINKHIRDGLNKPLN